MCTTSGETRRAFEDHSKNTAPKCQLIKAITFTRYQRSTRQRNDEKNDSFVNRTLAGFNSRFVIGLTFPTNFADYGLRSQWSKMPRWPHVGWLEDAACVDEFSPIFFPDLWTTFVNRFVSGKHKSAGGFGCGCWSAEPAGSDVLIQHLRAPLERLL